MQPQHPAIRAHVFLEEMLADPYFPNELVRKGQQILLDLCAQIEAEHPAGTEVYALTHEATRRFNDLAEELTSAGSDLETAARENIGRDVRFLLRTYGYDVDLEEAIEPRTW